MWWLESSSFSNSAGCVFTLRVKKRDDFRLLQRLARREFLDQIRNDFVRVGHIYVKPKRMEILVLRGTNGGNFIAFATLR